MYALPATARGQDGPPCEAQDRVEVHPWWSVDSTVWICKSSYVPERAYDEIGFCSGQAEPGVPTPPRPGCGCGPLLLGCIPGDGPLAGEVNDQAIDEIKRTASTIMFEDRSFDELLTATSTWQTGLVEFLYLRRELLAELKNKPFTPALEASFRRRIAAIDLTRPGRWIARTGIYARSGLYTSTPAAYRGIAVYRTMAKRYISQFLCTEFDAVHVDSEVVLRAVGNKVANIRSLFSIGSSPMRTQVGCSGCHAPLDSASAMMIEVSTPLLGNAVTRLPAPGALYVSGAEDLRGKAAGMAGLGRLVVAQPEFASCAVERMFERIVGRPPLNSERSFRSELLSAFQKNGHHIAPIIRTLVAYALDN